MPSNTTPSDDQHARTFQPHTPNSALNQISELIQCLHRQHTVAVVDEEVMLRAVDLRRAYSLSYWDSLIAAAALLAGATRLLTEDMQDGLWIEGRLQIVNPLVIH